MKTKPIPPVEELRRACRKFRNAGEAARSLCVSRSTFYRWLNGQSKIPHLVLPYLRNLKKQGNGKAMKETKCPSTSR